MSKIRMLPLTQKQRLQQNRRKKLNIITINGVRLDSAAQIWYRKQLLDYIALMEEDINNTIVKELERKEFEYVQDGFIADFARSLNILEARWSLTNSTASILASGVVGKLDKTTKERLNKVVSSGLGVDIAQIVSSEGLTNTIESAIENNVGLIKSIPEQYLDKIRNIILNDTIKGRSAKSMIEQIQEVHSVTKNRARLIARDQSNKINGDLTRERQQASGIRAFRWRTVGDDAVRETHKKRSGKVYAWSPADVGERLADGTVLLDPTVEGIGFPGEEIQCRCIAEPIIELDRAFT